VYLQLVNSLLIASEHECQYKAVIDQTHGINHLAKASPPRSDSVVKQFDLIWINGRRILLDIGWAVPHERGKRHAEFLGVQVGGSAGDRPRVDPGMRKKASPPLVIAVQLVSIRGC